jgi:hypothetical protein
VKMTEVVIELLGVEAETDGVEWTCENEKLEKVLNDLCGRDAVADSSPVLYIPDMALAMADLAVKKFNVKILRLTKQELDKDAIY